MSETRPILVETVDPAGRATGEMEKLAAHQPPGVLHRAFSLFAFDDDDRLVLQRRAASKYHSPLVWTNTACGHPFAGEEPADAVRRRAREELGAALTDVEQVGTVLYQVLDERSGLAEHEYNHVFVARLVGPLVPAPDEVDSVRRVDAAGLDAVREEHGLTAWFPHVWDAVRPVLADRFGGFDRSDGAR
ncbi:isopentenyl-diphosphate Delta-isomerase [Cellulomonas sp. PhB143]|uniref:isopentenyl-diphosphate Delta-isomerase n=1 Tax=Cellulomonas sp. PhB143 TaxID=2485186 RepID=UPI000FA12E14|nr:isopentenyl-diphosphate Delta-isomerase [Cellulomonas sp. PhB143]ROS74425.1 isopentenyl-diphosphate delta-isomerase [Cellulomonas sp. PhB143]